MTKILITGVNGFVGSALCMEAVARGFDVRGATRNVCDSPISFENIAVGDINADTEWHSALMNCDVVIHLAARVHIMSETVDDSLSEFRLVNTTGTECLARCAATSGVKRLVYVSSIKVNGEETSDDVAFCEQDQPNPQEAYGISKWEAEQALHRVAAETGMEVVIVRPPLVYGPGVKGNFAQMLRVVTMGIPLPFAGVKNQRELIYVGNLVDALITCATHPAAAGNTYLVGDGESVSTPYLLRGLAKASGVSSRVFAWPVGLLKLMGALLGKADQVERLFGSLQVDSSKIRRELGWEPPYRLQEGLNKTVVRDGVRNPESRLG
ncbi:SDR family oxidoreductase [Gammaproteobacteria bacterium]|nr:SDR family oxidoreductase [Gammaproteobacteria bacterium]